jgi:hypothetical protein
VTIEIQQVDSFQLGETGTTRAIVSFVGSTVTIASGFVSPLTVGACVQFSGTTSNDGNYSVMTVTSPTVFTVSPTPNPEPAAGQVSYYEVTSSKQANVPITATTATRITAPTALFQTNLVQVNDRVVIDAGTNSGAWFVSAVVSETQIDVRPLNGEPAMTPGGSVGNNISVRQGHHQVRVVDHGASTNWADIEANAVFDTQQLPGTSDFGSGVVADYVMTELVGPSFARRLVRTQGIGTVVLVNTLAGQATDFISENEVVVNMSSGTAGGVFNPRFLREDPNSVAGRAVLRIGNPNGGDRHAAIEGSAWSGWTLADSTGIAQDFLDDIFANEIYGSYVDVPSLHTVTGGEFVASILRDAMQFTLQGAETSPMINESVIHYPGGVAIYNQFYKSANVLFTEAASGVIFWSDPSPLTITVEGILKSDLAASLFQLLQSGVGALTLIALNSRIDYGISELVLSVAGGATAQKQYTFNPRFVERHSVGIASDPTTISGLKVNLYITVPILGEIPNAGNPFTTAASGRIEGYEADGRDGVNLASEAWVPALGGIFDIPARMTVEGAGYRFVNQSFIMRTRSDFDFPIDFSTPDLEEEQLST